MTLSAMTVECECSIIKSSELKATTRQESVMLWSSSIETKLQKC